MLKLMNMFRVSVINLDISPIFLRFKWNGSFYIYPPPSTHWLTDSLTHQSALCSCIPFEACPQACFISSKFEILSLSAINFIHFFLKYVRTLQQLILYFSYQKLFFIFFSVCIGTNGRMSVPSNKEHHYRNLRDR